MFPVGVGRAAWCWEGLERQRQKPEGIAEGRAERGVQCGTAWLGQSTVVGSQGQEGIEERLCKEESGEQEGGERVQRNFHTAGAH